MAEVSIGALPDKNQDPEALLLESRSEEQEFARFMPKTGFIAEYLKFTDISEPPGSYHFWTAMSLVSSTVQRQSWLSKGIYRVYPNLYIVLVAPSGKCRKTGAIRAGEDIARHLDYVNIIADKTTPEALLEALMDGSKPKITPNTGGGAQVNPVDSTGFIRAKEMSTFLNRATYSNGMITILTDLYDCPDEFKYRTRTKQLVQLDNVFISMIAATTPEWLATNLPEAAFEGGFMSRVIWVVKHWRDRLRPLEDEPDPKQLKDLVMLLNYINRHHMGPMIFEQDAKDWYIKWYTSSALMASDNEKMSGFHERLPDTIIKVAMLLQASDIPGVMSLKLSYLKQAEKIMRWTQERMYRAFEATELSRMGQLQRRINSIIDHYGVISRRDVLRKVAGRLDYKGQLEDVEKIMQESGELVIEPVETGKKGRPRQMYRRPLQVEL